MIGITIALGILAIVMMVLGILGGIMTLSEPLYKYGLIAASVGCGLIMLVLITIQAIYNDRDLRNRDAKIDKMGGSLENMQGQLTAFRELGARILTPSTAIPQPPHEIPKSIKDLSNTELRTKIIQFANNMRDFETNFAKEERKRDFRQTSPKATEEERRKQWIEQINISTQRRMEYDNEFRKRFLGEAIIYRDELINRLNIMPPQERVIAFDGFLAGVNPINELATYLEKSARQLPQ